MKRSSRSFRIVKASFFSLVLCVSLALTVPSAQSTQSPTIPAGSLPTEPPLGYLGGNGVEYLIDGVKVYKRVDDLLDEVAAAGEGGYVHMSFWEARWDTFLLDKAAPFFLQLKKVAKAGNEVKLLLWVPGKGEKAAEYADKLLDLYDRPPTGLSHTSTRDSNEKTKKILSKIQEEIDPPGSIEVQLLPHPDYDGSYHEKTMIFATCHDDVKVIVGGLNMGDEYRDEAPHLGGKHWHDVAVQFSGPAAVKVEDDFKSRWGRLDPPKGSLKKLLSPPSKLGDESVMVTVTDGNKNFIRSELLDRIKAAEEFIYMENFAIHDPDLVTAMADKLGSKRDAGQPFDVILLVNDKTKGENYSWLHFVTYSHLSFKSCSSFTYYDGNDKRQTVTRDGKTTWKFDYGVGPWYEDATVTWDTGHANIKDIITFKGDTPLYHLINSTGPTEVYVHSKVSIFDDQFAGIGSANFNPRSMKKDGELTAFIFGKSVPGFRAELWKEYFTPPGMKSAGIENATGATWKALAKHNRDLFEKRELPNGLYVLPLRGSDFVRHAPEGIGLFGSAKDY